MYVVTGASGRTGRAVARHLLDMDLPVRVIGRSADRLATLVDRGAEPFEAEPTDPETVRRALAGATAVYSVLVPNYIADSEDFGAFQDRGAAALSDAVAAAAPARVVALSSWGADKPVGTGPVAGLHRLENRLSGIPGVPTLCLRAGYFMENLLDQADMIRRRGVMAGPFLPDVPFPLICTADIGSAAAEAMIDTEPRTGVRELHGERDLTLNDAARIIGTAIGRPDLRYVQYDVERFRADLRTAGVSANVAGLMVEVVGAINSGHIGVTQARSPETTTPTSFEKWVRHEFVAHFNATD